jgi:hypothetical protein
MSLRLLNGEQEYVADPTPEPEPNEIEVLRAQVNDIQEQLNTVTRILMQQYGAFKMAFGDSAIMTTDSADKWTAIKNRMAPRMREAVDVLLLQGSMKRTQLAAALKMDYSNCNKNVIQILLRQGWMVDNNGNLSLKPL